MKQFTFYKQTDKMNCGAACLRMISKFYGINISMNKLIELTQTTRLGSNLLNISNAAEKIGFKTLGVKINFNNLREDITLPSIISWQQKHFVIVIKINRDIVHIADPAYGILKFSKKEFIQNWQGEDNKDSTESGICLIIEPTSKLNHFKDDLIEKGVLYISKYLFQYKKLLYQLIIGLTISSIIQISFPFLTQSIVDIGIHNNDFNFIYLVLVAQLILFVGQTSIEIIRGWTLLHLSSRINISLISDFFVKLMNLPIAYFDSKMTGDIMQRINDHHKIENLLTSSSLNTLFSVFNLLIFSTILAWYNFKIFLFFLFGTVLYFIWVLFFLNKRKEIDYRRFSKLSEEQSKVLELINGMQEIKLFNAEKQKRWGWEYIQARLFKISLRGLAIEQIQSIGSSFINELKNIIITIYAANLVIEGKITLGVMLAISFILGQLNSPTQQILSFIYSIQDANIALERLAEIHNRDDEFSKDDIIENEISDDEDIEITNLFFKYEGGHEDVLKGISLTIPRNKTTAIVGASGSGKTTLMKILLKFYEPNKGMVTVGNVNLNRISHTLWRENCGVVMQDGYIFNDTIANNIALGENEINSNLLYKVVELTNLSDFIQQLPLGFKTKIGMEGLGMSSGQKQRVLIARALYKNPKIILFDEATSALDAKNEKIIIENLNSFFVGRTALVIAHRLSTVKNADQIIVLQNGEVIEIGTHDQLVKNKGSYFELIKNQLELGN